MISITGIIEAYGLFGLFISSLVGSTIFLPFSVDLVLPVMLKSGLNPYSVLITATIGSLLGTWINYLFGYMGSKIIYRHVKEEKVIRTKKIVDRYGWLGLLIIIAIPFPLPVDPITILLGIARMNFIEFTIIVFLGKLFKYSLVIGMLEFILKVIP